MLPDVLATEASEDLQAIWSPLANVHLERRWWVDIMETQQKLGVDIPDWAVISSNENLEPYADVLRRIRDREFQTKHDVKARLEIFCEDAGHEYHHLGLTSADVVENTLQIKVARSLRWLQVTYPDRFDFRATLAGYPLRGIKGPVGTQQDQLDLLGSAEACRDLDLQLAERWGFASVAGAVPQVMWRSLDLQVVSALAVQTSWSKNPLCALLRGFMAMVAGIAGETWNEGDVASSVVRRVAIPGAIYAADLICRDVRL